MYAMEEAFCSILFLADFANKGSVWFPDVLSEDQRLLDSNLHGN